MSASPQKRTCANSPRYVCFVPIVLQKSPSRLCEIEICNNRIGASIVLNRCCSFVPDLESIFRDQMPKILLQQYLPEAVVSRCSNVRARKAEFYPESFGTFASTPA